MVGGVHSVHRSLYQGTLFARGLLSEGGSGLSLYLRLHIALCVMFEAREVSRHVAVLGEHSWFASDLPRTGSSLLIGSGGQQGCFERKVFDDCFVG